MASQGPNSGSSFTNVDTGGASWSNPSNASASDNSYATWPVSTTPSDYLTATGFGFSIPTGATINGIVAEVERKAPSAGFIKDSGVYLTKNGTATAGSNKADTGTFYPTSDTYATYGSSSDLWGTTWTVAEINSANFGLLFSSVLVGELLGNTSVDHVRITVYYTPAPSSGFFGLMRKAWDWLKGEKRQCRQTAGWVPVYAG